MATNPNIRQLTDVLQRLYERLGGVVIKITDGSASVAVDTKMAELLGEGNVDDFLNGGTLIVVEDFGGAHAAPEGEIGYISDYDSGSTTITVDPALSAPMSAGDRVMYVGSEFPYYDMVEQVNHALEHLQEVPIPNDTITIVEGQTVYDLPLGVRAEKLLDVLIQTSTVVGDEQYVPVENWGFVPQTTQSVVSKIIVPYLPAGYKLRLVYEGVHPRVNAWNSYISEYLHPDLVHAVVFAFAVQWKNDQNAVQGGADDSMIRLESKAWSQFDRARIMHPPRIPPRRIAGMPHWNPSYTTRDYRI